MALQDELQAFLLQRTPRELPLVSRTWLADGLPDDVPPGTNLAALVDFMTFAAEALQANEDAKPRHTLREEEKRSLTEICRLTIPLALALGGYETLVEAYNPRFIIEGKRTSYYAGRLAYLTSPVLRVEAVGALEQNLSGIASFLATANKPFKRREIPEGQAVVELYPALERDQSGFAEVFRNIAREFTSILRRQVSFAAAQRDADGSDVVATQASELRDELLSPLYDILEAMRAAYGRMVLSDDKGLELLDRQIEEQRPLALIALRGARKSWVSMPFFSKDIVLGEHVPKAFETAIAVMAYLAGDARGAESLQDMGFSLEALGALQGRQVAQDQNPGETLDALQALKRRFDDFIGEREAGAGRTAFRIGSAVEGNQR